MPRKMTMCGLVVAGSMLASPALGAEGTDQNHGEGVHVGLGVGLETTPFVLAGDDLTIASSPFSSGSIAIPVDFAGMIRIEPSIGYYHFGRSSTAGGSTTEDSTDTIRIGVGLFYRLVLGEAAAAHFGLRLGPLLQSSKSVDFIPDPEGGPGTESTRTVSRTDFAVSPVVGGEYFLSNHFSVGMEVQFNNIIVGDETVELDPDPNTGSPAVDRSELVAYASGAFFARLFFM